MIPIKSLTVFFVELEQKISQFIWKHKRPQITKSVLKKKNRTGGINLPDFRLYYNTYSHRDSTVLAQRQKYRSLSKTESPEINPYTYGNLIFDKGGKNIQWGKDSLFNK